MKPVAAVQQCKMQEIRPPAGGQNAFTRAGAVLLQNAVSQVGGGGADGAVDEVIDRIGEYKAVVFL